LRGNDIGAPYEAGAGSDAASVSVPYSGFQRDNGSEFLNRTVAKLLNKLLIEFTKSRAYRTTDNAQVEGKNGAVVRKLIGYGRSGPSMPRSFRSSTRRS
jgi:hypothetical protein